MWTTQDGTKWTTTANIDFVPHLGVTALVVAGNFIFCGYEGPFPLNPGAAAAAAAGGASSAGAAQGFTTAHGAAAAAAAAGSANGDAAFQGVTVGMIRVLNLVAGEPQKVEVSATVVLATSYSVCTRLQHAIACKC
jgi:hypothetical protein